MVEWPRHRILVQLLIGSRRNVHVARVELKSRGFGGDHPLLNLFEALGHNMVSI